MDKKEFKQFIESVAEIKELKPVKITSIRQSDDEPNEVKIDGEWEEIDFHNNPTLGFKFVKLKDRFAACTLGCGDIVSNQVIEKKIYTYPEMHWRTNCKNCGCCLSPDGSGFIKGGSNIQTAFINYFKGWRLGPNDKLKVDADGKQFVESTVNDTVIRRYK